MKLGCSNGVVYHWINRIRKSDLTPNSRPHLTEPYFRYIYANNADIWIDVLRDELNKSGFRSNGSIIAPVRLVCGTIHIHKGVDHLAAIVANRHELDPFDGNYYAFCGNERDKVRVIRWDGGGFQLMTRRREHGRYVWPPLRFGMTLELTAEEFEFVLNGSSPSGFSMEMTI